MDTVDTIDIKGTGGRLAGKVAVVTGGDSGIGLATAKRLVADGAYVFITGRRKEALDAAVEQIERIERIGQNVTAVVGDVSQLADLDHLFATVRERLGSTGRIDILFANAGIAEGAPLGAISEEQFDRMFGVNVKGTLFTVQKALPLLAEGASIILTSSIVGSKGFADRSVYSATKAALRSFARTWTTDLKPRKIRVNVVSPGTIDTPGLRDLSHTDSAGLNARFRDYIPLGRVGQPEDIADVVAFLASDDSRYITGIELFVDGGLAQV
jgi:NAD(P)-dependent dehydrogenase (short-subunit alcohol dehydrogenase family)